MPKRIRKRDLILEFLQLLTGIGVKKGKKAAPRFELGIKDLQSSALPLGHAADRDREVELPSADRISDPTNALLVISNGHGEDQIALRVIEALHALLPNRVFDVLPLVGEGKAFGSGIAQGWIRRVGTPLRLPSGGFSNQSLPSLFADIAAGLFQNTWKQWCFVHAAARNGTAILVVGDVLPLFFAWSSGAHYGFVGTPKSDYTWRSCSGWTLGNCYHAMKGTEWEPWEYALMGSSRCKLVATRDELTARGLRRHGVDAKSPGNPMMDGLMRGLHPAALDGHRRLLLLCGSRMPEALKNFQRLMEAFGFLEQQKPTVLLVPLGSEPTFEQIEPVLETLGYHPTSRFKEETGAQVAWEKDAHLVLVGEGQFACWASWAEVGLANAGTATEQLVGLGIPALSLPGEGPQFKRSFALRQSRLLGGAVLPCRTSEIMAERLGLLLNDASLCRQLGNVGKRRMGPEGGSASLALLISRFLLAC